METFSSWAGGATFSLTTPQGAVYKAAAAKPTSAPEHELMPPAQTARSVGFRCLLLTFLGAAGCSSPAPDLEPPTPTKRQLESVGDAYVRATIKLNRPPAKMEEFLPSLAEH